MTRRSAVLGLAAALALAGVLLVSLRGPPDVGRPERSASVSGDNDADTAPLRLRGAVVSRDGEAPGAPGAGGIPGAGADPAERASAPAGPWWQLEVEVLGPDGEPLVEADEGALGAGPDVTVRFVSAGNRGTRQRLRGRRVRLGVAGQGRVVVLPPPPLAPYVGDLLSRPPSGDGAVFVRLERGLSIEGRVLSAAGEGLAHAEVDAVREVDAEDPLSSRRLWVRADAEGRFVFEGLLAGRYALEAHTRAPREVVGVPPAPLACEAGEGGVLLQFRAPVAHTLRLCDARSGEPVHPFGRVVAETDAGEVRVAALSGPQVSLPALPEGTNALRVVAEGYHVHRIPVGALPPPGAAPLAVSLQPDPDALVPVVLYVLDDEGGPVPFVDVVRENRTLDGLPHRPGDARPTHETRGREGRLELRLAPEVQRLVLHARDAPSTSLDDVVSTTHYLLPAQVMLRLDRGRPVTQRVVLGTGGAVRFRGEGGDVDDVFLRGPVGEPAGLAVRRLRHPDGSLELHPVPAGRWRLDARRHVGHGPPSIEVEVRAGETTEIVVPLD